MTQRTPQKKSSCFFCSDLDNDEMLQCDNRQCNAWAHLNCVGVTEEKAQQIEWYCDPCSARQKARNCVRCNKPIDDPLMVVACNENCGAACHAKCLGFVIKAGKTTENITWICDECKPPTPDDVVARRIGDLSAMNKSTAKAPQSEKSFRSKASSTAMSELTHAKLELIREQRRLKMEQAALLEEEKQLITQQIETLSIAPSTLEDDREHDFDKGVIMNRFLQDQSRHQAPLVRFTGVSQTGPSGHNLGAQHTIPLGAETLSTVIQQQGTNGNDHTPPFGASENANAMPIQSSFNVNQWTARQSIGRKLPTFSGRSEEWPSFISAYENSTKICGFNDQENLVRLQESIRHPARAAVESLMHSPAGVSRIIRTLRMMFAQPTQLFETHMEKFKKESPPREDTPESVLKYATSVQNLWAVLQSSKMESYMSNPLMMDILIGKLPQCMRYEWDTYQTGKANDMMTYMNWLDELSDKVCRVNPSMNFAAYLAKTTKSTNVSPTRRDIRRSAQVNYHQSSGQTHNDKGQDEKCVACSRSCKSLSDCQKFVNLKQEDRWTFIRSKGICKQCLKKHHLRPPFNCSSGVRCKEPNCNSRHHTLIHRFQPESEQPKEKPDETPEAKVHYHSNNDRLLFRYVKVKVKHDSKTIEIGAFLDEGSSGTFMDEELAKQLGASGPKAPLCIHYTSSNTHKETDSMTLSLKIQATHLAAKEYLLREVQTVKDLSLSSQSLDYVALSEQYDYLRNLPVKSYQDLKPRLLIGLNNWKLAVPIEVRLGEQGEPIAAHCSLGWTIFAANVDEKTPSVHYCNHIQAEVHEKRLDEILKFYYSIESLGIKPPTDDVASLEERRALETMKSTMRKQGDKFEVGLLWKHDDIRLPESYQMALNRLRCLEARMRRKPQLAEAVHDQMRNTIEKGYARKIDPKELDQDLPRKWYLPVFPVENPNKPGKVRNVFDAAAKSNDVSLNDCLLKGPDQNSSLLGVLLRFRERRIGIAADIREMFMQVKIRQPDCYSQLFLYRQDDQAKIDTYVLESMTFGASCSPAVAQFVKNSNAEKFTDKYPRAVQAIVKNHYVDDLLDSVDDEQEAIELIQQVRHIHAQANFEIRGWKSNSKKVMTDFGEAEDKVSLLKEDEMQIDKVLGMWWRRSTDVLTYSLRYNKCNESVLAGKSKPTKIDVLRTLMSLYDPLGLLSPVTSILKVLMQDIWRSGVDWKAVVTDEHHSRWLGWLDMLKQVENLSIPRCYLKRLDNWTDAETQLHVFMDASRDCCAAVAYLRVSQHDEVVVSLIMGKSKVAPIKLMSIPRLELVAAVLGARISNTILSNLSIDVGEVFYWVDSTTVLSWIRSDTRNLTGQYEKFRVAEIQDTTKIANWRYINTRSNVADDATKMTRSTINSSDRWFTGPPFLLLERDEWPQDRVIEKPQTEKKSEIHVMNPRKRDPVINFERYSKWDRLVAVVAYVRRFIDALRQRVSHKKMEVQTLALSVAELSAAEKTIIQMIQMNAYPEELRDLKQGKAVSKNSKIHHLSPMLKNDVLKVDVRIQAVQQKSPYAIEPQETVGLDTVNPVILPRDDYGTELLIRKYHEKYLHINHGTAYNEIRQKYVIPGLWLKLKQMRRNCPRCALLTAGAKPPRMANLPPGRLATYTPPFTYTGVDCLGPINVTVRRRTEKRWVALFTCMTTRAVHLEVLHGMDHDSFILAFRCFVNRRGQPNEIFSDNGTNFVKAERILREDMKSFNDQKLAETMARKGIVWHFNPPEASHMGGVWERLVRSVKQAFYASMPTRSISDPMFRSLMTEIENMINSRPLTFMPIESEESEALTPNHLLLGSSSGAKPIGVFDENAKLLRSNWLNVQLYTRKFWKRWILEYLPVISRRTKWFEPTEPLKEGDLVLLIDPEKSTYQWQRGRVHSVRKAADGQVRSVVVRTSTGLLTRPTVKLAKLEIQMSEPESLRDPSGHRGGVLGKRDVKTVKPAVKIPAEK